MKYTVLLLSKARKELLNSRACMKHASPGWEIGL